jgi:hypothetical protein
VRLLLGELLFLRSHLLWISRQRIKEIFCLKLLLRRRLLTCMRLLALSLGKLRLLLLLSCWLSLLGRLFRRRCARLLSALISSTEEVIGHHWMVVIHYRRSLAASHILLCCESLHVGWIARLIVPYEERLVLLFGYINGGGLVVLNVYEALFAPITWRHWFYRVRLWWCLYFLLLCR